MKKLQDTDLFVVGRGASPHKCTKVDLNQLVPFTDTAPATPQVGALWVNKMTGLSYIYNGTAWIYQR